MSAEEEGRKDRDVMLSPKLLEQLRPALGVDCEEKNQQLALSRQPFGIQRIIRSTQKRIILTPAKKREARGH